MAEFRNTARVPVDTASGRLVPPGGQVSLPDTAADREAHDQAHIDAGRLIRLGPPPDIPPEEPAAAYAEVLDGTVEDVVAYLDAHPDEVDAVVAAETAGRARRGITDQGAS